MKKVRLVLCIIFLACFNTSADAQCVMCRKTASSLDDKAAKGLNNGIIYLALMPLGIMGFLGYKWWQRYKETI